MERLTDTWQKPLDKFMKYIKFERRMANNSIESYMRDITKFALYASQQGRNSPQEIDAETIEVYLSRLYDNAIGKRSQSRILSSLKSFFKYMLMTEAITESPTEFIDHPKIGLHLPDVLTIEEVGRIIDSVDTSTALGQRNRAMFEMLYCCGLRVTELVSLKMNDLIFNENMISVMGKGDKQRLVPICDQAIKQVKLYVEQRRQLDKFQSKYLFLSRLGRPLSRIMVFEIIKEAAIKADITKSISPHTFRHSFATHLLQGGASIRQVQLMLGHESITTTEIYTHLDSDFLRKTLDTYHPLAHKKQCSR